MLPGNEPHKGLLPNWQALCPCLGWLAGWRRLRGATNSASLAGLPYRINLPSAGAVPARSTARCSSRSLGQWPQCGPCANSRQGCIGSICGKEKRRLNSHDLFALPCSAATIVRTSACCHPWLAQHRKVRQAGQCRAVVADQHHWPQRRALTQTTPQVQRPSRPPHITMALGTGWTLSSAWYCASASCTSPARLTLRRLMSVKDRVSDGTVMTHPC